MASKRVSPSPRPGSSSKSSLEMMDQLDEAQRRPSSAASRQAWSDHDNEGFDAGTEEKNLESSYNKNDGMDAGPSAPSDEEGKDHAPTAMESEVYMQGEMRVVDPKVAKQRAEAQQAGCWTKFLRGLRSLWRTRQTDDTKQDKDLHVRTTLRELLIYLVFLVVLCIMTFGMTESTMYYYTKVMSELFLDSPFPDTKNTFRGMTTMMDFWRFTQGPLMDGLYWETWYNEQNVTNDQLGYIFYENKLLGVPRIRHLKVGNQSCTVHSDFEDNIRQCYAPYSEGAEDQNPYGKMNGTAWVYSTEEELGGSGHWGKMTTYGGGGFFVDLTRRRASSQAIIDDLRDNLWLDRGTRATFIDFSVYNANINLFCIVRLVVEYPATGGALPWWTFRTVKLLRYVDAFDYFVMACEGIFVVFILYYTVEEILEIRVHRWKYFKSVWNCLDVIIILVSMVCMGFYLYRTMTVDAMIEELLSAPEAYADFEYLGYWATVFNSVIAVAVFLAWIKVFKYISFNKTMTQLSSTLSRCAKDVGGFTIMFLIIFLAYAQLGYLVFGTQIKDFSTIGTCIFTLFRIVLGDFDFHELEAANRVLGPLFFMTYVFVVFFVLLNMFLAIINDTYSEVKADIATQQSEFEIGAYFKKGYDKMVGKLNFKRDKIADIQEALAHADANDDQHLDFDEWRTELKNRGHADAEIEAVFAKYDVDGDRILDAEEQMKMAADLEGQKTDLNNQLAELEEAQLSVDKRPGTSNSRATFNDGTESEEGEGGGRGGGGVGGVAYEEFVVLSRRVDRMEHSIGSIVSKIDAVLVKLEAMERAKLKRRETMGKLLDSITEEREVKMAYKTTADLPGRSGSRMSNASRSSSRMSSTSSYYSADHSNSDSEDEGGQNPEKRQQMERLVREELERWDSDASFSQQSGSGGRPQSGRASAQRSRPGSQASQRGGPTTLGQAGRSASSLSTASRGPSRSGSKSGSRPSSQASKAGSRPASRRMSMPTTLASETIPEKLPVSRSVNSFSKYTDAPIEDRIEEEPRSVSRQSVQKRAPSSRKTSQEDRPGSVAKRSDSVASRPRSDSVASRPRSSISHVQLEMDEDDPFEKMRSAAVSRSNTRLSLTSESELRPATAEKKDEDDDPFDKIRSEAASRALSRSPCPSPRPGSRPGSARPDTAASERPSTSASTLRPDTAGSEISGTRSPSPRPSSAVSRTFSPRAESSVSGVSSTLVDSDEDVDKLINEELADDGNV